MTHEEFNEVWRQFLQGTEDERKNAFNCICLECRDNLGWQARNIFDRNVKRERYIEPRDLVHDTLLVLRYKDLAELEAKVTSLDGLRGYLSEILKYTFLNKYRSLGRDGGDLPDEDDFGGADIIDTMFRDLPIEYRFQFISDDEQWKFSAIFNGIFKRSHELCYSLLKAHYVDGISYSVLIEGNYFPQYDNTAAIMQIAHRNKQDFRKLW